MVLICFALLCFFFLFFAGASTLAAPDQSRTDTDRSGKRATPKITKTKSTRKIAVCAMVVPGFNDMQPRHGDDMGQTGMGGGGVYVLRAGRRRSTCQSPPQEVVKIRIAPRIAPLGRFCLLNVEIVCECPTNKAAIVVIMLIDRQDYITERTSHTHAARQPPLWCWGGGAAVFERSRHNQSPLPIIVLGRVYRACTQYILSSSVHKKVSHHLKTQHLATRGGPIIEPLYGGGRLRRSSAQG